MYKKTGLAKYLFVGVVLLITFLVYLSCVRNDFIDWDDEQYVINNVNIRSFNLDLIKSSFFSFHVLNWHPLTWISHAIDYAIWGLNPVGHHLTNVILHAINSALVVLVAIQLLTLYRNRTATQTASPWLQDRSILIVGGVTGLLFGLHPLHVESVAWVSERKDLLCALFFLLSIRAYIKYVSVIDDESVQRKWKVRFINRHYLFTLGFFVLALLSKPMAVSLPFVLLLLDWYPFSRSQSFKAFRTVFIEKLPFIIFILITSILTIQAQKAVMGLTKFVSLSTRALVAFRSLITYLWEIILPVNLIPYYPYPMNVSLLSVAYGLTFCLAVGITVICVARASKERLWLSLWAYYVVTLIPVLGIIQVGTQSMADRYTYLPSLGPFLMMGLVVAWIWSRMNALRQKTALVKVSSISVFILLFSTMTYLTFEQIGIWKDSIALWSYAIEKEPEVPPIYTNRGLVYNKMGKLDKAIEDFDKAIALDPSYTGAYFSRGMVFGKIGKFGKAIEDFDKAIALNPSYTEAYFNRGLDFAKMGKFDKAIDNFDKAIALNPSDSNAYYNRGLLFYNMDMLDKAIENFDKAIALNPFYADTYNNRGIVFAKMGKFDKAIDNFDKAIDLNPSYTDVYENRGLVFSNIGNFDKAIKDFDKAIALNPSDPYVYYSRGIVFGKMGKFDKAIDEFGNAININPNYTIAYRDRGNVYYSIMGNKKLAISDFQKACELGDREGCKVLQSLRRQ